MKPRLVILRNRAEALVESLRSLTHKEVLVGFPEESGNREEGADITNAALAYIHDNGAPEQNIPARLFMKPAIDEIRPKIAAMLKISARYKLDGRASADTTLDRVGLLAQAAVRRKINSGIPPPLADSTLRGRARQGKKGRAGAQWELAWRAAGAPPGTELAKPLVNTGQLRNAVSWVVRKTRR